MPQPFQSITRTNSKTGAYVFTDARQSGLTLKLQSGVTSVSPRRIVSIQEDSNGRRYAVPGLKVYPEDAYTDMIIIGYGVIEEALQSGGLASIAPDPDTLVDGDIVTVLNKLDDTYMVDYDTGQTKPTVGIATCQVNLKGQLTTVGADADNIAIGGAVFESVPGEQMNGQLKTGCMFYKLKDSLTP